MSVSAPDPRYFKDGYGLKPRRRFFFHHPLRYLWLRAPRWYVTARCRRNDRREAVV